MILNLITINSGELIVPIQSVDYSYKYNSVNFWTNEQDRYTIHKMPSKTFQIIKEIMMKEIVSGLPGESVVELVVEYVSEPVYESWFVKMVIHPAANLNIVDIICHNAEE